MTPNPQNADKFDVEEECEQKAIAITGSCNCHISYTSRGMKDLHCDYHNFAPEIKEALAAAVKRIRSLEEALSKMIEAFDAGPIKIESKLQEDSDTARMAANVINNYFQGIINFARKALKSSDKE